MKIGNVLSNAEMQNEFTTTGEMDVGFAAMCRLLGGVLDNENHLMCEIPVFQHTIKNSDIEPEVVCNAYLEIGAKEEEKKNLRVWFIPKDEHIVVNFGNFEVGSGPERLEFVCNVTEKDNQVDVSCRSKNGKFQIRTHKYRLYLGRWSPAVGSAIDEEIGTYVHEIGVGPVPSKAIGMRHDNYVWVVPAR